MPETAKNATGGADNARAFMKGDYMVSSSWLNRVYAAAIDGAIVIGLTAPVMLILVLSGAVHPPRYNGQVSAQFVFFFSVVLTIFVFLYPTLWIYRHQGQTVGKRILGIRVVCNDGTYLGLGHAAIREILVKQLMFGFAASFSFGAIQVADVLWPFVDGRNRCLHDIVARTRVIDVLEPVPDD